MSDRHAFEADFPNGNAPGAADRNDPVWDELQREFADHLASAAEEFQRRGVEADEALRHARTAFGDVPKIMRQCWWIKQGDAVMTRIFLIALLAVVTAGTGLLTYGGWHVQQAMSARMDHVTEQLASLAASQQTLVEQQLKTIPGQLEGSLYLGDPSRPAMNAQVTIYRAEGYYPDDIYPARTIASDSSGKFRSGPLPAGQYFVVALLLNQQGEPTRLGQLIQSRPLEIHDGGEQTRIELDLLATGVLKFVLDTDLPDEVIVDGVILAPNPIDKPDNPAESQTVSVETLLSLAFYGVGCTIPRPPALPLPPGATWPAVGGEPNTYLLQTASAKQLYPFEFGGVPSNTHFAPTRLPQNVELAPGKYTIGVDLVARRPPFGVVFHAGAGSISIEVLAGTETIVKLQGPDKLTLIEFVRSTLSTTPSRESVPSESRPPGVQLEVQPSERRLTGSWVITGRRSAEVVARNSGGSIEKALSALGDPVWLTGRP